MNLGSILLPYLVPFLFFSDGWIRPKATDDWGKKIETMDTAIILGFGFEKDSTGKMLAGAANQFLLDWVLSHTQANTLLVQEGVWAAAHASPEQGDTVQNKNVYRIHPHDDKIDVTTFEAAFCALQKLEKLGKKQAVLVAHDLQLARMAFDFEKIKQSHGQWQDIELIIPQIPQTPFPRDSVQWRTRNRWVYAFAELFFSRLRDYLSRCPEKVSFS